MIRLLFFALWMTVASVAAADVVGPMYGRENLAAFYAALVRARADGTPVKVHFVGDSKVSGNGSTPGYRLDQLLTEAAHGYPINVTFDGHGGQNSYFWSHEGVSEFLSAHVGVDLLIIDFGTNERVSSALGGPQTIEQTADNNLSAIRQIRAKVGPGKLSILIMGQPPANNWTEPYQQTTEVMREVNTSLKGVASETDSAFFDPLDMFARAHSDAGWMEQLPSPKYGGGNVHTGDAFNMVLIGELARYLFPMDFRKR